MKTSLNEKLHQIDHRYQQISQLLSDPLVINDQPRFRALSKELAQIEPIVQTFRQYQLIDSAIEETTQLQGDPEMQDLVKDELSQLMSEQIDVMQKLKILLLPEDPDDERNVFLEVRAGTGGNEAALFAGELFRMYSRYTELRGWTVTVISENPGEQGGFKEIIARIEGDKVYSHLRYESGVHRVQRVPATESQGRIHTSACTVAVLPEAEEIDHIALNPAELRIDTFRASGAGGQHVNKTDSAIRVTHLPTNIVVECQDERSQHKNRSRAISLLQAKLLTMEREKQAQAQAASRRSMVGSGDRSERIRTYNFPQGRLTDHRINLTLYKLEQILEGELSSVIESLARERQLALLAEYGE